MKPIGYVVQQHGVRLRRPVKAYDKWVNRMPEEYARNLLGDEEGPYAATPQLDTQHALATVKHFRTLVPMAQEARKPIFHLTSADGAIGSHAAAANDARRDFKQLAGKIARMVIEGGRPPARAFLLAAGYRSCPLCGRDWGNFNRNASRCF